MPFVTTQPEASMHSLEGLNTVLLCHHTARTDFTGGNEANVDLGGCEGSKHSSRGAGGGSHPSTHSTHACDGIAVLQRCAGPLGEQRGESYVSPGTVLFAQDEADVSGAISVLPF
jgi:hypothetical protein